MVELNYVQEYFNESLHQTTLINDVVLTIDYAERLRQFMLTRETDFFRFQSQFSPQPVEEMNHE
jgi:hypothetical protein